MKKLITIITLSLVTTLLMSSCSLVNKFGYRFSLKGQACEKFEELMREIEEKDLDGVKSLFAKDAIENSETLDEDIEELFEYFDGTYTSYEIGGLHGEQKRNENGYRRALTSPFEVENEKAKYRIYIRNYVEIEGHEEYEGIKFIYIIKAEDDIDLQSDYHGDVYGLNGNYLYSYGVNIGIPNEARKATSKEAEEFLEKNPFR